MDETISKNLSDVDFLLHATPLKNHATTIHYSTLHSNLNFHVLTESGGVPSFENVSACLVPHSFLYLFDVNNLTKPREVIDLQLLTNVHRGSVKGNSREEKQACFTITTETYSLGQNDGSIQRPTFSFSCDKDIADEWVHAIQRERYNVVREERDAYQLLQESFSMELQKLREQNDKLTQNNDDLKNDNFHLGKALSESRQKVDELQQTKEFVENQLLIAETASELNEKLIAKDQEISMNQDVVMQSIIDTKESKEEISRLSRLVEVYTTKLESSNTTIKKMEESYAELNETLSNIKNEKKQLKQYAKQTRSELEEVDNLKKEIGMLKTDMQQKDKELADAFALIRKLEAQEEWGGEVDEDVNVTEKVSIFHFNPNT